ncbi:hypothetical protein AMEX_G19469 [Astyanax mexicanus]|uniref:Uncharacterized protein n=1 Tax=Astyanax mexicanus TaxID=7994 RepID=A0A8T2LCZ7_ASTMX|nr:hypothetical protein AMEX_G19469 [Astyanax mexicanus]
MEPVLAEANQGRLLDPSVYSATWRAVEDSLSGQVLFHFLSFFPTTPPKKGPMPKTIFTSIVIYHIVTVTIEIKAIITCLPLDSPW